MTSARKVLAALCAGLFVATAVCALALFNISRKAFTAATYTRVLANEGFYDRLPAVFAETITSGSVDESQLPFVMRGMSTRAWEAFFGTLLPAEALKAIGDQALGSIFSYLKMESDSAQMSLLPLKRSMTGDAGVSAVYTLLNAQPACTLIQVAQMTINLIGAEDIQYCKPPAELYPLLTPAIGAQMELTAFLLPDQITLASAQGVLPQDDPRTRLKILRILMGLTPIVPLGFLLLLTILAVNSFKAWLDWWGVPFLFSGVLATLAGTSGAPLMGGLIRRIIAASAASYLPDVLSAYASDLASAMVRAVLQPVLWSGVVLMIVGLAMALSSRYLVRKTVTPNADPSEANTIV